MTEWDTVYLWSRLRMRPGLHHTMNPQEEATFLNLMSKPWVSIISNFKKTECIIMILDYIGYVYILWFLVLRGAYLSLLVADWHCSPSWQGIYALIIAWSTDQSWVTMWPTRHTAFSIDPYGIQKRDVASCYGWTLGPKLRVLRQRYRQFTGHSKVYPEAFWS